MANCATFSPDGSLIASGNEDTVQIWNTATGQRLHCLNGHTNHQVTRVAFSSDGVHVVSAGSDGVIKVWDSTVGRETLTIRGHAEEIHSVSLSSDGAYIVSGSQDRSARVWDFKSGAEIARINANDGIRTVAFGSDAKWVALCDEGGLVQIWEVSTGKTLWNFKSGSKCPGSMSVSFDGRRIAIAVGSSIQVLEAETGKQVRVFKGHTDRVYYTAWSRDGNMLVSSGSDGTVRVWNLESNEQQYQHLVAHEDAIVTLSRDFNRVASGGSDGLIDIWDAFGQKLKTLQGHPGGIRSLSFSSDGARIASGGADKALKVWSLETGRELASFVGWRRPVNRLCFSKDGSRVVAECYLGDDEIPEVGDDGNLVRVFDLSKRKEIRTIPGCHFGPVDNDLGRDWIFVNEIHGDFGVTVRILDLGTDSEVLAVFAHRPIICAALSADGRHLATGSLDSTVGLWKAETGHQVFTLNGHEGAVRSVAFTRDGKRLVSGSDDRQLKIWNTDVGIESATFKGHTGPVSQLRFTDNDTRLMSAESNGTARIWKATIKSK